MAKYSKSELGFAQTQLSPEEKLDVKEMTGERKLSDAIRTTVLFYIRAHSKDDDETSDNN